MSGFECNTNKWMFGPLSAPPGHSRTTIRAPRRAITANDLCAYRGPLLARSPDLRRRCHRSPDPVTTGRSLPLPALQLGVPNRWRATDRRYLPDLNGGDPFRYRSRNPLYSADTGGERTPTNTVRLAVHVPYEPRSPPCTSCSCAPEISAGHPRRSVCRPRTAPERESRVSPRPARAPALWSRTRSTSTPHSYSRISAVIRQTSLRGDSPRNLQRLPILF